MGKEENLLFGVWALPRAWKPLFVVLWDHDLTFPCLVVKKKKKETTTYGDTMYIINDHCHSWQVEAMYIITNQISFIFIGMRGEFSLLKLFPHLEGLYGMV